MLLHKTLIAELAGCMKAGIEIHSSDVHISYLPLAHIYEKMLVELLMANGASIGFYSGVRRPFDFLFICFPSFFVCNRFCFICSLSEQNLPSLIVQFF